MRIRLKRGKRALIALYLLGLILFLELASSLILDHVLSAEKRRRFEAILLKDDPYDYNILPHPFLGWVSPDYMTEQTRILSHISERNTSLTVVALGGSTTASGWPFYTERYLNARLKDAGVSKQVAVFNLASVGWNSVVNLQAYVWIARFLHPDFVVIHQNPNDNNAGDYIFDQAVLQYPAIDKKDTFMLRHSRFYRLLRFLYFLSYNSLHYGQQEVTDRSPSVPVESRISSYINQDLNEDHPNPFPAVDALMTDYVNESRNPYSLPMEAVLAETYGNLIKYTSADNTTLILTTHYLNYSQEAEWWGWPPYGNRSGRGRFINEFIRNLSRQHGVPLVDFESIMAPYDNTLGGDGMHFTPKGEKIKGKLVGEAIFQVLMRRHNLSD